MSSSPLTRITHLARPVDPAFPTNRIVLVLLVFTGLGIAGWRFASGMPAGQSLGVAGSVVLSTFLAWALVREWAPDQHWLSLVALPLCVAGQLAFGLDAAFLALLVALMAARIANRCVSASGITYVDIVLVVALAIAAIMVGDMPQLAAWLALVMIVEAFMSRGIARWLILAASILVLATLGVMSPGFWTTLPTSFSDQPPDLGDSSRGPLAGLLTAGLFALTALLAPRPSSPTDLGDGSIRHARLRWGIVASGTVVALTVVEAGMTNVIAALAALATALIALISARVR